TSYCFDLSPARRASTLFPYTTLFRSLLGGRDRPEPVDQRLVRLAGFRREAGHDVAEVVLGERGVLVDLAGQEALAQRAEGHEPEDRKSTRLNSSHDQISYAVFCLKKK